MRYPALLFSILILSAMPGVAQHPSPVNVMPVPAQVRLSSGRVTIEPTFSVAVRGHNDARLQGAIARALRRWEERTGFVFPKTVPSESTATLVIECAGPGHAVPSLDEDEAYTLQVDGARINLRAATVVGAMRGLETLLQLLSSDAGGWFVPAVSVEDRPRFPWRGLMIDVCRHWQPMEVIKRNLDGMALVKLNVLHLHLTEDQGFRIESKKYPRLHQLGSDGNYFTHEQIREIIAYAQARGIRVMPEFDIPGHATSWVVGHPELASAPGPYQIERRWGIFDPTLDPTNEAVYELLDGFLGEMAALFPDPYLHIGGDEVNGKQWNANEKIQAFIREKNLTNNEGLQAYFNRRVLEIVTKHGKKLIGWDEILHPDLPKDAIVHSWRGPKGLADASRAGHATVLSNGYYIDLMQPASQHYLNDPLPANTPLTPEEQKRVLGGEATMWSEWTSPETIDSRIWPRTAAIAERLWSPREVNSVPEMYRRLAIVNRRLEEAGLTHEKNAEALLRQFGGDSASAADLAHLRAFVAMIEPLKEYRRGRAQRGSTQFTPLTGIADCARADSPVAREFAGLTQAAVFGSAVADAELLNRMINQHLLVWQINAQHLVGSVAGKSPRVREIVPLIDALRESAEVAIAACEVLRDGTRVNDSWRAEKLAVLTRAAQVPLPVELAALPSLRLLVAAASIAPQRTELSLDEWRKQVETLAAPEKPAPKAAPSH